MVGVVVGEGAGEDMAITGALTTSSSCVLEVCVCVRLARHRVLNIKPKVGSDSCAGGAGAWLPWACMAWEGTGDSTSTTQRPPIQKAVMTTTHLCCTGMVSFNFENGSNTQAFGDYVLWRVFLSILYKANANSKFHTHSLFAASFLPCQPRHVCPVGGLPAHLQGAG